MTGRRFGRGGESHLSAQQAQRGQGGRREPAARVTDAPTCSCAEEARQRLAGRGVDLDAHVTPALDGQSAAPAVIGTCEHGTTWPARDAGGAPPC